MNQHLILAQRAITQVGAELQAALHSANAVEALVLMPMIGQAHELKRQVEAFLAATTED